MEIHRRTEQRHRTVPIGRLISPDSGQKRIANFLVVEFAATPNSGGRSVTQRLLPCAARADPFDQISRPLSAHLCQLDQCLINRR